MKKVEVRAPKQGMPRTLKVETSTSEDDCCLKASSMTLKGGVLVSTIKGTLDRCALSVFFCKVIPVVSSLTMIYKWLLFFSDSEKPMNDQHLPILMFFVVDMYFGAFQSPKNIQRRCQQLLCGCAF